MTIFLNEKMMRLHSLIRRKSTGSPTQLAQKLDCAESTIHNWLRKIRDGGLPIKYCNERCSYVYDGEVQLNIRITLNGKDLTNIQDGLGPLTGILKNNFATLKNLEPSR